MLFRPLKAWYLFGIRIPMTPGIIPSKRGELADNIGEMVGSHLLTHKDIGAALSEERFQDHLSLIITTWITKFLETDLDSIQNLVPDQFEKSLQTLRKTLKKHLQSGLQEYRESDAFADLIAKEINAYLNSLDGTEIGDLVNGESRQKIYRSLTKIISKIFSGTELNKQLSGYLYEILSEAVADEKIIADILPRALVELTQEQIRKKSPEILKSLAHLAARPLIQERIAVAVNSAIKKFIDSLGPLGALAGNLFDPEMINTKIRNYFDDKDGKVSQWLSDPSIENEFTELLLKRLNAILKMPIADLIREVDTSQLRDICDETANSITRSLQQENTVKKYSTLIEKYFETLCGNGQRKIGAIVTEIFSDDEQLSFRSDINRRLIALLRSDNMSRVLERIVDGMLDQLINKPIGRLDRFIPGDLHEVIGNSSVRYINQFLLKEVPGLVDSLDIRRIVVDKVNTLDLLQLEGLLLSIMEEQFKYINLFGALLGFIIGFLNLVFITLS